MIEKTTEIKTEWVFGFPERALKRWARELLCLKIEDDDTGYAVYKYYGSTCNYNTTSLALDFKVRLSGISSDCRIVHTSCVPGDAAMGMELLCGAEEDPEFYSKLETDDAPLLGQPLVDVLEWSPEVNPAGCVCSSSLRNDKWLMVYQTILYKLRTMGQGYCSPNSKMVKESS